MGEREAPNRWAVAVAGIVFQLSLGAVYAWSVFRDALAGDEGSGWTISQVAATFSITIFVLGFAAFLGGQWMRRSDPRRVALAGALLYASGVALSSLADGRLWLLYLGYGLIGGIGIGLGYIVPISVLVKWFPDKRGLITGLAVGGFGAGALITAPLATRLIDWVGVMPTFALLGMSYLVLLLPASVFLRNPPAGYRPAGWQPDETEEQRRAAAAFSLREALRAWQWYALWGLLFLNVVAGIGLISEASPMAQEITGASVLAAAGVVGAISVANGVGRVFWAWLSDAIGRERVFLAMFVLQAAIFAVLPLVNGFLVFTVLAVIVVLCYGGGFGTMPAFAADYFGSENVGSIYGLMLTAWSFGGVAGPLLFAGIRDTTGAYTTALYVIVPVMVVGAALSLVARPPRRAPAERGGSEQAAAPSRG